MALNQQIVLQVPERSLAMKEEPGSIPTLSKCWVLGGEMVLDMMRLRDLVLTKMTLAFKIEF